MGYIVLSKDEFSDTWTRQDVGDVDDAKVVILGLLQSGKEVKLTTPVDYELRLTVRESKESKTPPSSAPPPEKDKGRQESKVEAEPDKT